jgi:SPP1 gp7 family putative phage head morphogenesis protein
VDASVDSVTRDLVKAWATAWDDLEGEWRVALAEVVAQSDNRRWPSRALIYRVESLREALEQSEAALLALALTARSAITSPLVDLTSEAAQWQARLMSSQLPAPGTGGVALSWNRVDPLALEAIVRRTSTQVTSTLIPLSGEATAVMNRTLIQGIALGQNPRQAAREMLKRTEGGFNGGLTRALNVARTEMLDAHRAAAYAQNQANRDLLRGWQWSASFDQRTCPSCLAMDGTEFPVDMPGPLDHQQGRCTRLPVTLSWKDLGFDIEEPPSVKPSAEEWFADLSRDERLRIMGPGRLELLDTGKASWSDLATKQSASGWRDSYKPTSVKALTAMDRSTRESTRPPSREG